MSAPPGWPALVLAAGFGTRLGPLGQRRAKAAMPVAGRPIIVRILQRLRDAGVTRVVVNLHHQAASVCDVVGDGSRWGLEVRYSWEGQLLGSAGGPARALPLLAADRFYVVNGDTLAEIDLKALAAAHRRSGAVATLAVTPADLGRYNALLAADDGALVGSVARGTDATGLPPGVRPWHFVGVQAVDARALAGVAPDRPCDIVREVYPARVAARAGAVRVWPVSGAFFDVGTPSDYLATAKHLARREGGSLDRGFGTCIDPTARVETSILWDRVTVGAGAALSDCIVADDVVIAPGVRHVRQVITPESVIPL